MTEPLATIIIPTFGRPALLGRAIASALAQTAGPLEVVVVDDGSVPPAQVPADDRVRLVRLPVNQGGAVARNAGLAAARGRFAAFLDDDDTLVPTFVERSLAAWKASQLPQPVAVLSGIEVVDGRGTVVGTRRPPDSPRGATYGMARAPAGRSWLCKQTLFAETELLRRVGGFDEAFRSRVHSELFLRLNQACSVAGLPDCTYRLTRAQQERVSTDTTLRDASFDQLVAKHRAALAAHPQGFARMLLDHAATLRRQGDAPAARRAWRRAVATAPGVVLGEALSARLRAARRTRLGLRRAASSWT